MAISVGDAVLKITGDTKDLDRSMSGLQNRVKKGMAGISKQLKVAGAAFTALGVAGLKLAGDSRKLNAQLGQVAIGLGLTTAEVRDLTLETTNVTFPLKSVANTFELLTRAGIKDQQMLMDSATAFDTLADATGSTAEEMAELLLPAFKLFGEALPTTAKELDRFTFLAKTTTVDLQDFGTMLTRMAPEMDTLNLSMDDAVLTLAALSEKGIEGSAATLALRTAITKAAREGTTLNEVMGITPEIIARLTAEMEGATGITQEYADAANTQFGVMDKLKQKWSELALRAGSFLEPMEPILAGITVLGPVMILLSTSVGANAVTWVAHTVALIASKVAMVASAVITAALTAAQWLLNAAMAANPIGLVVIAIGALIVAGVLLWKNWGKVTEFFKAAWESMKQTVLSGVSIMLGALAQFLGWIPGLGSAIQSAHEAVENMIDPGVVEENALAAEEAATEMTRAIAARATELTRSLKKELDQELQDRLATVDAKKQAAEAFFDDEVKRIWKKFGEVKEEGKSEIRVARDIRDAKIRNLDEVAARATATHRQRLDQLEAEHRESLSDLERALQAEIDVINAKTDLEADILREQRRQERQLELEVAVLSAEDDEERARAAEALSDFLVTVQRERLLEERTAEIDALRERIQSTRDGATEEALIIRAATDQKIEIENARYQAIVDSDNTARTNAEAKLVEDIARIEKERDEALAAQDEMLAATTQALEDGTAALKKEHGRILSATDMQEEARRQIILESKAEETKGLQEENDAQLRSSNTLWDKIRTGMVNAFKGGINTIIGYFNSLIRAWNALEFGIPPVKVLGRTIFPGVSIGTPDVPLIPRLAEGGIITKPTLALIGENGPEAVVPLDKGMGTTFIWNQFGPIWNDQDMEDKVGRFVKHIADRGGLAGVFN